MHADGLGLALAREAQQVRCRERVVTLDGMNFLPCFDDHRVTWGMRIERAYRDLTGDPPSPRTREGKRKRWAITLLAGERIVFARPPCVEAVFSLRDPKPGLVHLARWGLKGLRGLKRTKRSAS